MQELLISRKLKKLKLGGKEKKSEEKTIEILMNFLRISM